MWLVLLSFLVLFITRTVWMRLRYDVHKIPSPPGNWFLGHTLEFVTGQAKTQMTQWLRRHHEQLGCPKIMKMNIFSDTYLLVADEKVSKEVTVLNNQTFLKRMRNAGFVESLIGNDPSSKKMFLTAHVTPYVKAVRRIYTSAFQSSELKKVWPKFQRILEKVTVKIESLRDDNDGCFDCQELFIRMTIDMIGEVALNSNLGGLDGSRDIYQLLMDVSSIQRDWAFNPLAPYIARIFPDSKHGKGLKRIHQLTSELDWLTKRIMTMEDPEDGEEPVWFGLKHLIDPETENPLKYNGLRAEAATIMLSGSDTTGHQLSWTFALLASHPLVVERLIQELREHGLFGQDARDAVFEDLGDLKYLAAIIKESMRIAHIMIGSFPREAAEDTTLSGFRIPKGSQIMILGNRAVNTEADWGDPDVFRPERWFEADTLSNKYNLGFLKGPRDCVGQRLAMIEMRLTVLVLFKRYHITLKDGTYEDLIKSARDGTVIGGGRGIWLRVRPRD